MIIEIRARNEGNSGLSFDWNIRADCMKVINVGVVAHADAGKTSLIERLLFELQVIRQLGTIASGTTQVDSLDLEKSRGHV